MKICIIGPAETTIELEPSETVRLSEMVENMAGMLSMRRFRYGKPVFKVSNVAEASNVAAEVAEVTDVIDDDVIDTYPAGHEPMKIVPSVEYNPSERELAARHEWGADHPDVGQHDTWKILVQFAMWRHENPAAILPSRWSGRLVDHAPLFPLHPQVCEAMRRLHPWRLCAAAMGCNDANGALRASHGAARMDAFLSAHIAAAKVEAGNIYERCVVAENQGGPANPYKDAAEIEQQFVIFPSDLADVTEWISWPDLKPLEAGVASNE